MVNIDQFFFIYKGLIDDLMATYSYVFGVILEIANT
jgi:hypothetical protein